MRRLLREPLLHFVLLGAALFALDALRSRGTFTERDDEIIVSTGRVENLSALFEKTWQRPPTAEELRGLVDDFVLEEALYREGIALGVDRNDTVIRRRVRQKMEFVVNDIIEDAAPTEADLKTWLANHPDLYRRRGRHRFRQIYLSPERHGESLAADADEVLAELRALDEGADPRGFGDPSLLEHAFSDVTGQVVIATFGKSFAASLITLPTGEWSGPITSGYGLHLVHVEAHTPGTLPPLDQVRALVERDWRFVRREEAAARYNETLLDRYRVEVQWPVAAPRVGDPGASR